MEITKYSNAVQKFLKQEYGSEENAKKALEIFKKEAEDIMTLMGINITEKHNVLLELYSEQRIYSAMGDEKIATLKLESFNKLLKNISSVAETKEKISETVNKKGMLIFNE